MIFFPCLIFGVKGILSWKLGCLLRKILEICSTTTSIKKTDVTETAIHRYGAIYLWHSVDGGGVSIKKMVTGGGRDPQKLDVHSYN